MTTSKIPGFYKLSLKERRARIIEEIQGEAASSDRILNGGGLSPSLADQIVENVLGTYSLPFGVALNALINGQDRLLPMVVEEPSVIAAASNACKMIRAGGGFTATMSEALMIAQMELREVADPDRAKQTIEDHKASLLALAAQALPGLVRRGGGPRDLEVRSLARDHLVVHLLVDCRDAMGANLVNSAAELLGPEVARLTSAKLGLCILSNLSDRRKVTVEGRVPFPALADSAAPQSEKDQLGRDVALGVEQASIFAERDPYRAATHNKGIMNGVDSVVIATGNDYRAVEAGAHAFAARSGTYLPLATWRVEKDALFGSLTLPLALGTVGGTLRVHEGAGLALAIAQAKGADDLALLAASAGLASNLAALRALSTDGIQKGHMALHARSVAISAGAVGDEVNRVAAVISAKKDVTNQAASEALAALRKSPLESGASS
jgi:hydroxymethylglutaryl-CoA reductase